MGVRVHQGWGLRSAGPRFLVVGLWLLHFFSVLLLGRMCQGLNAVEEGMGASFPPGRAPVFSLTWELIVAGSGGEGQTDTQARKVEK